MIGRLSILLLAGAVTPVPLATQIDALWMRRDTPAAHAKITELVTRSAERAPTSYELLWRRARYHCWLAQTGPRDKQAEQAKRCWDLGKQAETARPERVEGHFWSAIGMGLWADASGILSALFSGIEGKLEHELDQVMRIDPSYEDCGAMLARAEIFHQAPWPKKDLARAEKMLEQTVAQCPTNMSARLRLAQVRIDRGEHAQATAMLQEIIEAKKVSDPPSARRVKKEARALAARISKR